MGYSYYMVYEGRLASRVNGWRKDTCWI